jgi:putative flippase GtrA
LATFLKHQAGAIFTTVVDFSTMILFVQLFRVPPVWATGIGASVGAVTNFTLGRLWIFEARENHAGGQAARYAVISATSLLLNMGGEWLVHDVAHLEYVIARAIVALCVSVGWNYPMHKNFVFGKKAS